MLEIASSITMIVLGILFFIYIPGNALNLATNFIFIGAGVLIGRRGIRTYRQSRLQLQTQAKKSEKAKHKQSNRKNARDKRI